MQKNIHPLAEVIDSILSRQDFQRKKKSWYLLNEETIEIVDLQKSDYGDSWYINLAIYLRSLGVEKYPAEYKSHIRSRLEMLVDDREDYESLTNLGSTMAEDDRRKRFERYFRGYALPWLNAGRDVSSIKDGLKNRLIQRHSLTLLAADYLGIRL